MTLGSHITEGFGSADQIINRVIDGVTNTGYTFNPRGDRTTATTAGVTTSYGYDQANHLTSYTPPAGPATTYAYNGQGLRTSKTTSGAATSYTWDTAGSLPLMLTAGTTSYIYGPDHLPIESIDGSGTPTYLLHDQLGSTRLLVSQAGDVTGTYTYDAWGNTTSHTGTATTPLQYAGQYLDNETGFYYLRNRYYDPLTAQFLTIDPLVAQTRATYTYTGNNPITSTDPTGLLNEPVGQSCNPEDQYCAKDARYPCQAQGIGCRHAAPVSQIAGTIAKAMAAVTAYSFGLEGGAVAYRSVYALSVRVSAWLATLGAGSAATASAANNSSEAGGGASSVGESSTAWLERAREAAKQVEQRQEFDDTTYRAGHAGENAAETIENAQKSLERVEPTGTETRVPPGGPSYTEAQSYASSLNDPMTQMFVNGAIASRVVWLLLRRIFGGGG